MAHTTKIILKSSELSHLGLPVKLGVYEVGDPRQIGPYFNVPIFVMREDDLHVPRPPVQIQADSALAARERAIFHYRRLAQEMRLEVVVSNF